MVLLHSTVPSLCAIFMMLLPCSAFTADRSVNIPTGWNIVPLLETEHKITVGHFSNEKTPATSLDKLLQPSDTKKSTRSAEQTISLNSERDRRYVKPRESNATEIVKDAGIKEETTSADTMVSSPRNAILLLVAESDHDQKDLWEDIRASHSFPVEGHLQSCRNTKIEASWFPFDKALVSGSKDTECDCEHYLRSNVATLLLWARDVKGMTTGTLYNSNFTIPSLFGYEEPASVPGEFDELDENVKLNIPKAKPEIRSDWYMIDLGKPVNHASSEPFAPNNRVEEDPEWNIFDVFSRVRMALFRSLLEALGRNVQGADSEEPIPFGRSHPSLSNFADIVRELKSIQNRKGFVLVAATPASELNSVMTTLQRELSQDVLVVVAGVCTRDTKPIIPFLAKGPAAKMLREAITIWDLPTIIRNILTNGYQDPSCRIRRRDTNSLLAQQLTTIPDKEAVPEKILQDPEKTVQVNDATGTAKASNVTDDQTTEIGDLDGKVRVNASIADALNAAAAHRTKVADLDAKEEKKDESKESPSIIKAENLASSDTKATKFTMVFGTIASILVTFIFAF